jgi:hypothetical protein
MKFLAFSLIGLKSSFHKKTTIPLLLRIPQGTLIMTPKAAKRALIVSYIIG